MLKFDRKKYFDSVRESLFAGTMDQGQVDGQNALLDMREKFPASDDLRHFAYMLATAYHETAATMLPIEEYGRGAGQPYGEIDPETDQGYWGRGYVQLTWRENYARAADELKLDGYNDLEWYADRALDPAIAARVMGAGMEEGWFRNDEHGHPQTLLRYFNATTDDAFEAREIINGDKTTVPSWSNGVSIGNLVAGYHDDFLAALTTAVIVRTP